MKKLYGVVIPLVTPLTDEGTVDVLSLERLTDYLIDEGMDCLYPCGTTGEMVYLTNEERKTVVETVVRQTAGRVPVFAQVGAANTADTIELAKHAVECGADGIGVVTPWYFGLSNKALVDFYMEVSANVPENFPIYLYGIPQNAVNDLSPEVAEEIASKCQNVVGIKYSFPDMTKLQGFMTVKNGTFSVLVGPDHLYEAVMAVGGEGVVSGNAMIIPKYYKALTKAIQEKNYELATKIQRKTNLLNNILCERNNIGCYKAVLKHLGIISTKRMRPPMEEVSEADEQLLLKALEANSYADLNV